MQQRGTKEIPNKGSARGSSGGGFAEKWIRVGEGGDFIQSKAARGRSPPPPPCWGLAICDVAGITASVCEEGA